MTSGGTLINTGQTGHLTTLSLHLIHGIGIDLTHGQDGIDGTDGGVTAEAGTLTLGTITGMAMVGITGMVTTHGEVGS